MKKPKHSQAAIDANPAPAISDGEDYALACMAVSASRTEYDKPHPGGRPTLYKAEYPEMARKFCLLGATDSELADLFGVAESTIHNWKLDHPEFLESIKAGKDIADANVASKLYHRATGYSHESVKIFANPTTGAEQIVPYTEHYPPETTACIFWLKNRQKDKWRDKTSLDGDLNLNVSTQTEEQRLARIAELTAKMGQK